MAPNNLRTVNKIYSWFFDESHNQKKWFQLFSVLLSLLVTIIFSVWGTIISVKSYQLSVEAANDHQQIDTMRFMLRELKAQNKHLIEQNKLTSTQVNQLARILAAGENISDIQNQQLSVILGNVRESKIPKLAIEDTDFEMGIDHISEFADINRVELVNYGGEIHNFQYQKIDSINFDKKNISSSTLPMNANIVFEFRRTFDKTKKQTLKTRFLFEDVLGNKYYQDLILYQNRDYSISFQLGKMTDRK